MGGLLVGEVAAPHAEKRDLLRVEDFQRGFADFQRLGHPRAALAHFAGEELGEQAAGALELAADLTEVNGVSESAGINRLETENERVLQRKPSQ